MNRRQLLGGLAAVAGMQVIGNVRRIPVRAEPIDDEYEEMFFYSFFDAMCFMVGAVREDLPLRSYVTISVVDKIGDGPEYFWTLENSLTDTGEVLGNRFYVESYGDNLCRLYVPSEYCTGSAYQRYLLHSQEVLNYSKRQDLTTQPEYDRME